MPIVAIQHGAMWARDFDDPHSHSVTIQVPMVTATAEIALHSTWTAGESHHASDAMITQIVSANGVENFPAENFTDTDLVPVVSRDRVTSVTFKIGVYQTKGMAVWTIVHWN